MSKLLILGGTADARIMAGKLHEAGVEVIYSVAGMVRRPVLDCQVISGGFSQFGGLANYLKEQQISLLLDATHPYASRISQAAVDAAEQLAIECWRYDRPSWQPSEGDSWQYHASWQQICQALPEGGRVFLSAGQLPQQALDDICQRSERVLLRTAVEAQAQLSDKVDWIKAIGPFDLASETQLLNDWQPSVLVSKDSGGAATYAKLEAARNLQIPVLMFQRPESVAASREFAVREDCVAAVTAAMKNI